MNQNDLEKIEINLLLEAIYQVDGYDFRDYARASLQRRIGQFLACSEYHTIAELIPRVLHDPQFSSQLVHFFSVCVTEMFRDPFVYRSLRQKVLPHLHSYPFFKIWHAGCATGEEVYSMAILLGEEELYERATLYATDFSQEALDQAEKGIYQLDRIKEYTRNYQEAGGKGSFSEYYHARYDAAVLNDILKTRITFASHNLATDSAFGEMHLVFARNVLIYFNRKLQNRALQLFTKSLVYGGFLCLGTAESIDFTEVADNYETIDKEAKIYRKISYE